MPRRRPPALVRVVAVAILAAVAGHRLAPGASAPEAPGAGRSLDPPVVLPDGAELRTWEAVGSPEWTRTYRVDPSHPRASDDGPGTEDAPFATISRAARVLEPGERVVIASGTYRERVRPARGGTGPDRMISYEAAPGARVVLKGSRILASGWHLDDMGDDPPRPARTWTASLDPSLFEGYEPFDTENVTAEQFESMSWAWPLRGKPPCTLVRGLVFQDGRRLEQRPDRTDLWAEDGTWCVDRPGRTLRVRPFGDADPMKARWEIATQETAFAPEVPGLGWIRVKGLSVEQVAGPFPWEQVGAISTTRGHHWTIEDNEVRQVNGVGIDVGIQHPRWPQPEVVGHHIVRRNRVTDCGICGICGLGPGGGKDFGLLVEDNTILRAAFHDVETLFETAGIKTHNNVRCLIRRNLVASTLHGPGIWMDWDNRFSRCSENVIVGTRTMHGGIFVEASGEPNAGAENVGWGTSGRGIYEHDSTRQVFTGNVIGRSSSSGFHLHGKMTDRRIAGRPIESGRHVVRDSLLVANGKDDVLNGPDNEVSGNDASGNGVSGNATGGRGAGFEAALDVSSLELKISFEAPRSGPEPSPPPAIRRVALWPVDPARSPAALVREAVRSPVSAPGPAAARVGAETTVIHPDGAWCWFQDERALIAGGKLAVASITSGGDVQVTAVDLATGAATATTLRERFDADDHNVPGLLARRDGRLLAFYARHHREPRMFLRVSDRPGDATSWGPEATIETGAGSNATYANPFELAAEGGRIHLFWRGLDFNPTCSSSDDGGRTWSPPANPIYYRKGERPYVKYASDGRDTIHFAFTEAHPDRPVKTSLRHACYRGGDLLTSHGALVRRLRDGPIQAAEATLVYDSEREPTGEAWVWDVAIDALGHPVIAYTSHPSPEDIRYRYARWNGERWEDRQIAHGGRCLYKGQEFYAGGICLDPDRPGVVYLSSAVDIRDGSAVGGGRREIHRGESLDGGATWTWEQLTRDSPADNLRPIVPARHPDEVFVLWFRGRYTSYTDFRTEVVLFRRGGAAPTRG